MLKIWFPNAQHLHGASVLMMCFSLTLPGSLWITEEGPTLQGGELSLEATMQAPPLSSCCHSWVTHLQQPQTTSLCPLLEHIQRYRLYEGFLCLIHISKQSF